MFRLTCVQNVVPQFTCCWGHPLKIKTNQMGIFNPVNEGTWRKNQECSGLDITTGRPTNKLFISPCNKIKPFYFTYHTH